MKDLKDVNVKELKAVVKELNDSGLIKKKITLVGVTNQKLLEAFTDALAVLPEDSDVPQGIADFYNDLYADEIEEEITDEESTDEEEVVEEESVDDEEEEVVEEEITDEEEVVEEEEPPVVTEKPAKKKAPPVVRDKKPAKTKTIGVDKRAEINPKLSLAKKVANLLNFKDGRYKMTSYFPLDVETIRVLEGNVGLYPGEIIAAIKQDKKAFKKIEKFSDLILKREINKIKSAYSYIVGAIQEDRVNGKLRVIMTTLLAGKEVDPEIGHYTTVKIARRALLAYMEVTGIDHKTMTQVKDEMVEKAASKPVSVKPTSAKAKPEPAAKAKPEPAAKAKPEPAKKPAGKSAKK